MLHFPPKIIKGKKINIAEQSIQILPRGTAGLLPSVKLNNPIKINTVVLVQIASRAQFNKPAHHPRRF
jgi:hypothetical protein